MLTSNEQHVAFDSLSRVAILTSSLIPIVIPNVHPIRYVALVWALPPSQTILAVGLDRISSHPISNSESQITFTTSINYIEYIYREEILEFKKREGNSNALHQHEYEHISLMMIMFNHDVRWDVMPPFREVGSII